MHKYYLLTMASRTCTDPRGCKIISIEPWSDCQNLDKTFLANLKKSKMQNEIPWSGMHTPPVKRRWGVESTP